MPVSFPTLSFCFDDRKGGSARAHDRLVVVRAQRVRARDAALAVHVALRRIVQDRTDAGIVEALDRRLDALHDAMTAERALGPLAFSLWCTDVCMRFPDVCMRFPDVCGQSSHVSSWGDAQYTYMQNIVCSALPPFSWAPPQRMRSVQKHRARSTQTAVKRVGSRQAP